jgi:uncharacterized protein (DUF433 family)
MCSQGMVNMAQTNYHDHITSIPGVVGGKPIIKGTRIPVEIVLQHLAYDLNLETLFADYPRLTREDVQACLAYAESVVEDEEIYLFEPEQQQPSRQANI